MKQLQARTLNLAGTNYEIGQKLGRITAGIPPLRAFQTGGFEGFGQAELEQALELFGKWCPGLNEELQGFADALGVPLVQVVFYGMTALRPRCSQIVLPPARSQNGHTLLARSYEFSDEAEDFVLAKTAVRGKYAHMGTTVLQFGREEGVNEKGLCVTMSSCGFPVGAMQFMRAPALAGLQFWAVIRSVLENCDSVASALEFLQEMPIAYNLNMTLADKTGEIALVETLDGEKETQRLSESGRPWFFVTNHALLPGLAAKEPQVMRHSVLRYAWLEKQLAGREKLGREDLKALLLSPYPNGLCCHYYTEYFGTTKSIVLDAADATIELCWGGRAENGWRRYALADELQDTNFPIALEAETPTPDTFEFIPRQ